MFKRIWNQVNERMDEISIWNEIAGGDEWLGVKPSHEAEYEGLLIVGDAVLVALGGHPGMAAAERLSQRFPTKEVIEEDDDEIVLGELNLSKLA